MKVSRLLLAAALTVCFGGIGFAQSYEFLGAGATFPAPLYSKMFDQYSKEFGVKVNYQSIGSGGGQTQIKNRTVDFGASDVIMTAKDLRGARRSSCTSQWSRRGLSSRQIFPGIPELKLLPDVVADIYLGKIRKWSDPRIAATNPGVKLPNMNITVVHRSDGSGTTGGVHRLPLEDLRELEDDGRLVHLSAVAHRRGSQG